MADAKELVELKQRLSARLLDEPGVSGVGLRGSRIVVYLESNETALRARVEKVARDVAQDAALLFEITGRFRKQ